MRAFLTLSQSAVRQKTSPDKAEFLLVRPLQREPAHAPCQPAGRAIAKTAFFTAAVAATSPGCSQNGGQSEIFSWFAGTAVVIATVLAGLFINTMIQSHKAKKSQPARVSAHSSAHRSTAPELPPGYIMGITPIPEEPVFVESAEERIARRFQVANGTTSVAIPFHPTGFYVPKEVSQPTDFSNFLENARNGHAQNPASAIRSQLPPDKKLLSSLAELMGNLVPELKRLKFHPPRAHAEGEMEGLDLMIRHIGGNVSEMLAASEQRDRDGIIHPAMHSLA